MKKKEYLMKELERLRKQQGELTQRLYVRVRVKVWAVEVTCGLLTPLFM